MPPRPVIRHQGQRQFARFETSSLSMASATACGRRVETIWRPPVESSERALRIKDHNKASGATTWSHRWLYYGLLFGFRQFIHRAQTAGTDIDGARRTVHNHMPALYIEYKTTSPGPLRAAHIIAIHGLPLTHSTA